MNNFIREIDEFYKNIIYNGDTDSLYIEKKYWDVSDKTKLVGKELFQGNIDYESGGVSYSLSQAPKLKNCLTEDKIGVVKEHKTFKSFNDSKTLLDRSQYFKMIEGVKYLHCRRKTEKKNV